MKNNIKEVVSKAIDHILDRNYIEYVNAHFGLTFHANSNHYDSKKPLLKLEFRHSESRLGCNFDFGLNFRLEFSQKDELYNFCQLLRDKLESLEIGEDDAALFINKNILSGWIINCSPSLIKELIPILLILYNPDLKDEKIFVIVQEREISHHHEPLALIS